MQEAVECVEDKGNDKDCHHRLVRVAVLLAAGAGQARVGRGGAAVLPHHPPVTVAATNCRYCHHHTAEHQTYIDGHWTDLEIERHQINKT